MRRVPVAFVSLVACVSTGRAADLDTDLALEHANPASRSASSSISLRRNVIRIGTETPEHVPPSGGATDDGLPRPRLAEARPRRAVSPPHDLVVTERLVVAPLPTVSAANPAANVSGALDRGSGGPRETTVPIASTGVLDRAAAGAYDDGLSLVRADRCHDALVAFASFLSRWPDHPHADNAMYWRGECLLRIGETQRGLEEFEALVVRYPGGNKAPEALLKLALTWGRLGDEQRAEAAARRLVENFPTSDAARRMRAERLMR